MKKQAKQANGELKIEKGIPIPARQSSGSASVLRTMEIGDSVVLPIKPISVGGVVGRILGTGNYASRPVKGGVRVWRTK